MAASTEDAPAAAIDKNAASLSIIVEDDDGGGQQQGTDDKNKLSRHPRWTKSETFVLIEGKNIAENQGTRGRSSLLFGAGQPEPKWDFVSSYCKQHGVNREPVQCRKRWSNLICDFKKIKVWESRVKGQGESFWMMRSDVRRDKKLPGFFDREVFDVLDGKAAAAKLSADETNLLPTISVDEKEDGGTEENETEPEDDEAEEVHEGESPDKGKRAPVSTPGEPESEEECRAAKVDIASGVPSNTIHTAEPISGTSNTHLLFSTLLTDLYCQTLIYLSKKSTNIKHFINCRNT